jgi:hypothetical protein
MKIDSIVEIAVFIFRLKAIFNNAEVGPFRRLDTIPTSSAIEYSQKEYE